MKLFKLSLFFYLTMIHVVFGQEVIETRDTGEHDHLTDEEVEFVLKNHNYWRSLVRPNASNMLQMEYDDDLAHRAKEYSSECQPTPSTDRSSSKFDYVGENIYFNDNVTVTLESLYKAISSWGSSAGFYRYADNFCSKNCDSYKQMVWAKSYAVGCGVSTCHNVLYNDSVVAEGQLVVCNYGPSSNNITGQQPYKTGDGCSDCPVGHTCVGCGAVQLQISICFILSMFFSLFSLLFT